ncbi:alpha/beta hydrolase family protein [Anaeromicropila herbilytica]|uniref:Cinnamoyl ester hydrolase n=1 Tax=Anaeromicropila herbilytica TaxID=2785025 RepID=A0A7R7ELI0_9FIRM|nr:alpha/beta fold hydrolase [Anaeromicropila herbilytica]BCN30811.1 cinnamoyl ester hydrolase [Anaeromicropila herbilytica]
MKKSDYITKEMPCSYGTNLIYGVLNIPQTEKKKLPVLILSHGYNSSHMDLQDIAKELAQHEIITYCYDFCGGSTVSKSNGNSIDMSIRTEQEDLKAVIEMIGAMDIVDENQIYLYGESQGGFVTALVATELQNKIAGMLLLYPAFCIVDDWNKRKEQGLPDTIDCMGMDISRKFYDELPQYDVFEYIHNYEKPVIIFHGDSDYIVPLTYAKKATASFKNASLQVYEGEGHGFAPNTRQQVLKEILEYFEQHS